MPVEQVPLELIDDNPYNPRKHYSQNKVKEMATSLLEHGLRQVPEGRRVDGRVQLAYGHMRLRGFHSNQKKEVAMWDKMPVNILDISDQDMFHWAMEENLRRTDITPIEVARCIQTYSDLFPKVTEKELGKRHGMTEANVSNMKRVLRLPQKMLDKIDEEIITFTQGRELLIFDGLPDAETYMSEAVNGLKRGDKQFGEPNTVEGLQKSIHSVAKNHFPPLDKEWEGYRYTLVFDTREAGCLKCDKMLITHYTKSQAAHFCSDEKCWQGEQDAHKKLAAETARRKMETEVLARAAEELTAAKLKEDFSQEKLQAAVPADIYADVTASYSGDIIAGKTSRVKLPFQYWGKRYVNTGDAVPGPGKECYQLVPREEYKGDVRTYIVPPGREYEEYYQSLRNDPQGFYDGMLVKHGKADCVLVGPPAIFLPAEKKKVGAGEIIHAFHTNDTATIEKALEEQSDQRDHQLDARKEAAAAEKEAEKEIPPGILQRAREAAGTRAEILDLVDISTGTDYYRQTKQGFVLLEDMSIIDDPDECLKRCTKGFHYAFDSKARVTREIFVCSDVNCLARKKGAFTRKKNASNRALKNAEHRAIQDAVEASSTNLKGLLLLIIYGQLKGSHVSTYLYSHAKLPHIWIWDKLSAGTKEGERKEEALYSKLKKIEEGELRRLAAEMMFYYLTDTGDIAGRQVKTKVPLALLDINVDDYLTSAKEGEQVENEKSDDDTGA